MPNRILRDWTASENVDSLDVHAERFFVRLIMKVDDYGRFSANVRFLNSTLFPLKSDIRDTDITRWLAACEKAGMITVYYVASKCYLQIENFNQQLRQKTTKYPSPDECIANDKQVHSNSESIASLKRNETETRNEVEEKSKFPPALEEVISYFKENNFPEELAKKAFNYYSTPDDKGNSWVDSKGNKVRGWKKKMQAVWFKNENRTLTEPVKEPQIKRRKL
nr:MAG TPA: hypothetical protein [Caudoviricetes sp.]